MRNKFGPQNPEEEAIFAEEQFRVHIQHVLRQTMNEVGISSKELAEKIGMSAENFEDFFFSSDCFVSPQWLAHIFHILGYKIELTVRSERINGS